ncbi:Acetyltransferase (GNAT) family protein [Pseudovibrio axinellae]|uniref:Acetyltransferase (GNAT) family protein n=1 Tax=Pseudovibrio axinellae TaxID=989403 RepID=A0A165TWK4_9HYPH|nr:GNAT family N-acetyltransferase [Pseudovibrio axinellae]KZL06725.1 Acetyltransferase (GNAT) family protein [Pseudovibrio axinellae]SER61955.1 Acetyltransferase (GNAT) family protein [Pseudovibrio axinellae]
MTYIALSEQTIFDEHICCAISDKKCAQGYQLKKGWLSQRFSSGYQFIRLDERAKVFIEFGPAEAAWAPVVAPGHLLVNCLWVSGKYKGQGHGKALLAKAVEAARQAGATGLVTIAGAKKLPFLSDGKWFKRQGFEVCDASMEGIELLRLGVDGQSGSASFSEVVQKGDGPKGEGLVAYYSNRCPFTDHHVLQNLKDTAQKRGLPLKIVHLDTLEKAQGAPTPATIFSLYWSGKFVTTDLSVCMDSRFDKIMQKALDAKVSVEVS